MEEETKSHVEQFHKKVRMAIESWDDPIPKSWGAETSLVNLGDRTYPTEMSYTRAKERIELGLTVACRQMKDETRSHVEQFHEKVKDSIESLEIDGIWFGTMTDLLGPQNIRQPSSYRPEDGV
jgi:hypothetical protein